MTSLCRIHMGHYFWDRLSNNISRIDEAEGLHDNLDILKDSSRQLTLSRSILGNSPNRPHRALKGAAAMKRKETEAS